MNSTDAINFLTDSEALLIRLRKKSPLLTPIRTNEWSCRWPEKGNGNRIILESDVNHKTFYMDVGQAASAQYALGFKSDKGQTLQLIEINETTFQISTVSYALHVPCLNFENLALAASGICQLIYFSEAYQEIGHLGDMWLQRGGTTYPIPIDYESKAISLPPLVPDASAGFIISSSLLVQKDTQSQHPPKVLTMKANFDKEKSIWRLSVHFYRPSQYPHALMPLRNGLLGLWETVKTTLSQNGNTSSRNTSNP